MASTATNGRKKMDFKEVSFDVNEIAPDAPEGEWLATIPRGKIKIQPTKEDKYPMMIVPLRLDEYKGDEEGEEFEKALGAELAVMIVFFGNEKARAARMSKLRLRQLCEATDVDLDIIPKTISSEADFADLVAALEGKKLPIWTKHTVRRDTDETVVDVRFQDPKALTKGRGKDGDEEEEEEEDERPARGTAKAKKTSRRS